MGNTTPRVFGYSYNSPGQTVEYKRFNEQYFTGADVRIYFNDIWLDEITGLQFSMQENVAPIFGYASYTWDKVARGSRQIQGQFSINFKESFYLQSALERLQAPLTSPDNGAVFSYDNFKSNLTLEQAVEAASGENFYAVADKFEKTFWEEQGINSITTASAIRQNSSYFTNHVNGSEGGQKELGDMGFNIVVQYGPMTQTNGNKVASTAQTLTGVQLTGVSQVVGRDGSPVEEVYTFIARDFNASL